MYSGPHPYPIAYLYLLTSQLIFEFVYQELVKNSPFASCTGPLNSVGSVAITGLDTISLLLQTMIQPGSSKAGRSRPPTKSGPLLPYTPGPLP